MRNILEKARKQDYDAMKKGAQAIYQAPSQAQAVAAFGRFRARWRTAYPTMVRQLEKDLPELLCFYHFPRHLWRKLRTTNVIERCFVKVRRRTRPMVCFVNVASVDRISTRFSTGSTWNGEAAPSMFLHKQLDITLLYCMRLSK